MPGSTDVRTRSRVSLALATLVALVGGAREGASQTRTMAAERGVALSALEVVGHADYDWVIRPLGGEAVKLESLRGRVLFINLWASWCTPCIREMETIERLRNRLRDTDVEFLIVATEGEAQVRRHLRRYPYDLPVWIEEQRMPAAFGLRGLPTTWIVDGEGRILLKRHGEAVWDTGEVEAFVRSLLDR